HLFEKTKDFTMIIKPSPIQPARFVVLVVGIAVASLRLQELISRTQHGGSVGQEHQAAEVLYLPDTQLHDLWWHLYVSLPATVPRELVIQPVCVAMTICPVALPAIRHQVIQGEAIVRGDVIYALIGMVCAWKRIRKEVIASIDPPHERRHHPTISSNETPDIVTKAAVPLRCCDTGKCTTQ